MKRKIRLLIWLSLKLKRYLRIGVHIMKSTYFIFLVIIVGSLGFMAGNINTSQENKTLQQNLASTTIAFTEKQKSQQDANKIFETGLNLLSQNKTQKAALYFSNAISHAPDKWEILEKYINSIIDWSNQQKKLASLKQAETILSESYQFTANRAGNITADDLPKLVDALFLIQKKQTNLAKKIKLYENEKAGIELKNIGDKYITVIEEFSAKKEKTIKDLEDTLLLIMEMFEQVSHLINYHPSYLELLNNLDININKLKASLSVAYSLEEGEKILEILENDINHKYTDIYLIAIQNILQKVILQKLDSIPWYQKKIDEYNNRVLGFVQNLKGRLQNKQLSHKNINHLTNKYEEWAVNRIKKFWNDYKNELGLGTNEEKIHDELINRLGNIDVRYLSTPGMTLYNEVFSKFYAELEDEQKISVSSKMALRSKRLLSDFKPKN